MKLQTGFTYTIVIPEEEEYDTPHGDLVIPKQFKVITIQPKPEFVYVDSITKEPLPEHLKSDKWYAVKYPSKGNNKVYWFYLQDDYYVVGDESC